MRVSCFECGLRACGPFKPASASELAAINEMKRDHLTLVTTEKDLVRFGKKGELGVASEVLTLPVTLRFDDEKTLRRFLDERLFAARQKKFAAT